MSTLLHRLLKRNYIYSCCIDCFVCVWKNYSKATILTYKIKPPEFLREVIYNLSVSFRKLSMNSVFFTKDKKLLSASSFKVKICISPE